jgi:hypothetical protein
MIQKETKQKLEQQRPQQQQKKRIFAAISIQIYHA